MPTYEYKCQKCGQFEVEQRITEAALDTCPTCGLAVKKLMPRRLFIQFKGPGFHVNDYSATGQKTQPATSRSEVVSDSQAADPVEKSSDKQTAKPDSKAAATEAGDSGRERPQGV